MKKQLLFIIVTTFTFGGSVLAQDWQKDFNKAKEIASKADKPIILVFQGSDWCAPCIKLNREVWSTDTFKKYAADHYVMMQADFPRKSKNALSEAQTNSNASLAETYNKNGIFPFVVVMDSNGNVLGETSYKKTTSSEYIKILDGFVD
tara:strand:+ start:474 stop:917 length:444 start_codon:yes stop_codon:yes gene_type:complete